MADDERLLHVLTQIQRRGGIGVRTSVSEAIEHARRFVRVIPEDAAQLVDLGSGGGLPGLVIAADRPSLRVTLVERRAKRSDLLSYGARALGAAERVEVVAGDVEQVIDEVLTGERAPADVVSARSFGPLTSVLAVAAPLLRVGGRVIVSLPPEGLGSAIHDDAFGPLTASDGIVVAARR